MTESSDVAFVIVNYNTKVLLADLLLFFETQNLSFSFSIIVVDNNSSDGSVAFLKDMPGVTVIRNDSNLGYGRAANRGIRISNSKYVCVLNTDVILNKEALNAVWNYMESNSGVGVCSPVVRYPDRKIQGFFFKFNLFLLYSGIAQRIYSKVKKLSIAYARSPLQVDGTTGAFYFFRSSLVGTERLYDEDFFFYYEDTDLAHRLTKRHISTMILPSFSIIHIGGQSGHKSWQLFHEGMILYLRKHYGKSHVDNICRLLLFRAAVKSRAYGLLGTLYPTDRIRDKHRFYNDVSKNFRVIAAQQRAGR